MKSETSNLDAALRRTHRLRRGADLLAACGFALAASLGAALIAILLDVVFGFGSAILFVIDALLLALFSAAMFWVARRSLLLRFDPRRVARLVEERLGYRDSRLINAVEFTGYSGCIASSSLQELAVRQADTSATAVEPRAVVDPRPLRRSTTAVVGVAALFTLLGLLAPRVLSMVVPRLLNPTADLPPFTLVRFAISIDPQRIYSGQRVTILATLGGPFIPESSDIVFVEADRRDRVAMQREKPGVFVLPLDRVEKSRRFYIDTPDGRSATHELIVLPTPLFESVTVRYNYPAYTGWPATERPLDPSGLHALIGTRATITVQSNLPLREGQFAASPEQAGAPALSEVKRESAQARVNVTLQPSPDHDREVLGSMDLTHNANFSLTLYSIDGIPSESSLTGSITITPDRDPSVQLMSPDLRSVAPEGWKVPVRVSASDDIGIGKVVLHRRVDQRSSPPIELALGRPRAGYATGSAELDLAAMGVAAGQTVRGFATAYDNHPDSAHPADSATFEVRVVTAEEYKELARQEYALQELLAELDAFNADRDRLEELRDELIQQLEEGKADAGKRLEEYSRHLEGLADRMDQRAEQMAIYSFEPEVQEQLKRAAQELRDQAKAAVEAPDARAALEQLKKDREAAAGDEAESHQTQEQLRRMELADRMMAQTDAVMGIAERQRELAERLSSFQGAAQPPDADERARLDRLAQEQEQLHRELGEALDQMERVAGEATGDLPKMSESARKLVEKVRRELAVERDQAHAAKAAQAMRGSESHRSADTAAAKLESLITECNGMGQCASDDLDGALSLTRSQVAAAMSELAGARRGSGKGSSTGTGAGAGSRGGTGQGAAGSQAGGAPSRATLLGPHSRSGAGGQPTARLNLRTGSYNTQRQGDGASAAADAAERLDPQGDSPTRRAAVGPPGVPLQYRTLAEQYFKRLAEDTKGSAK